MNAFYTENVLPILNNIRIKLRERFNKYLGPIRRKKLKTDKFTIISNNCWGGHVYRYFGLNYMSPTVGLYLFSDDYIKFVNNLKHYLTSDISFIPHTDSKYKRILDKRGGKDAVCPIGRIDDIEIIFLHYSSEEEAKEKWIRRCSRVVWDNIVYKMSEQNECTDALLAEFDKIPEKRKFCFVSENKGLDSQVIFKEYLGKGSICNDTTLFRKYILLPEFINGEPFKKRQ